MLDHLGALLLMYPRGRQFADDFPDLREKISGHFEEGAAAPSAALAIAADIMGELLSRMRPDERAAVLAGILAADPGAGKTLAADRLARSRTDAADSVAFAIDLTAVAIFMAKRMTEEGTLRREECRYLLTAIESALGAEGQPLVSTFANAEKAERP